MRSKSISSLEFYLAKKSFKLACSAAMLLAIASSHAQSGLPNPATALLNSTNLQKYSIKLTQLPTSYQNRPLTIDDVVAIALSTNRTLATQFEAYLQSKGVTTTSRAGLGPKLSAGYTYDIYNTKQIVNLGGQPVVISEQFQSQYTAQLSLPIDITGELSAAVSQSKYQEIAARLDINRARNQIVLDVKNAFFSVLRAQAQAQVAKDSLQNAVDRLADTQLRVDVGTSARYDLTTAKSQVASAEQTLVTDRSSLSQAFASLNNSIGIDVDSSYQLTTDGAVTSPPAAQAPYVAPNITPTKPPEGDLKIGPNGLVGDSGAAMAKAIAHFTVGDPIVLDEKFEDMQKEALANRPEILEQDANIIAARKGVFVARAGFLPTLNLGYNYSYTPDVGALSQSHTGYGSITLNIPLFDSGSSRGKVDQAKAQVASAEINRRTQVDSIKVELKQAYTNLQAAEISIRSAREGLAQADEGYRIARLRYTTGVTSQSGVSPIVELSSAQETLTQAQSNYVTALYDYNSDLAALDKALGRYSYTTAKLGFSKPPELPKL